MSNAVPHVVSTEWLAANMGREDIVVIDATVARGTTTDGGRVWKSASEAFVAHGHIAAAQYADLLGNFSNREARLSFARPSVEQFAREAGALGIGQGVRAIVYDSDNGIWAARFWWMLRAYGHDFVSVLDGGLRAWRSERRPIEFDVRPRIRRKFAARFRPEFFADKAEVAAIAAGTAPGTLICALRPPVFSGDELVYHRRGHIPRSINVPWVDLIDRDNNGRLRDKTELAEELPSGGAGRIVIYCGSGITAAGDALAFASLGITNTAIYDGSLSEWTADPSLPMALGA